MIKVQIPTPLRRATGGAAEVEMPPAADVRALLDALEARHAGIRERIIDERGEIRRFVNIFVNGDDVRFADGLATALKDGDEVSIVPAIAGG